ADLLHHFRCVPGVVALEDLENATRVLQRGVGVGGSAVARSARTGPFRPAGLAFPSVLLGRAGLRFPGALLTIGVLPARGVVAGGFGDEPGVGAVQVLGVAGLLPDDQRRVGVGACAVEEV